MSITPTRYRRQSTLTFLTTSLATVNGELVRLEAQRGNAESAKLPQLAAQSKWFSEASKGERLDWPPLPVLVKSSSGLEFVEGRHRSLVLSNFGALYVPVFVG